MKPSIPVFVITLLAFAACSRESAQIPPTPGLVIPNADLSAALADKAGTLAQTRSPLRFTDGRSVSTCNDYLAQHSTPLEAAADNFAVHSEYLICDALFLLENAAPVAMTLEPTGAELARHLDLRSFPSSLFNRLDERVRTLQELFKGAVRTEGGVAEVESPDWLFRLEVVAVANISGKDSADWLVWLSDEARNGSYRAYQTLLLKDVETDSLWVAEKK